MDRLIQHPMPVPLSGAAAFCAIALAAASLASFPPASFAPSPEKTVGKRIPDAEIAEGISLADIADPARRLVSKVVQTTLGEEVGRVTAVSLAADGTARMLQISLSTSLAARKRTVRIDAENLLYLKTRGILVSRFTHAETADLVGNGK